MSSEITISVRDVGKCFQIYEKPHHRLRQFFGRGKTFYHEFWALHGVSFDVRKGETVGVVGCNGSGKSTLLQTVCGTLSPTKGIVETRGRLAALLELGAGFNPEFSGRENVYMNAAILGLTRAETDAKFDEIAAFADIGEFIEQPVKTYSSGMYVRLAFAVQACIDPDILVIDEALAVGDERFQRKCFARMDQLKERGASILLVSHSAQNIMDLCDRAILLHKGKLIFQGGPVDTVLAYQKLIYATEDQQEAILAQLESFSQKEAPAERAGEGHDPTNSVPVESSSATEAYFDSELKSETMVSYRPQGAEIQEVYVLDAAGSRVNVLVRGEEYTFVFKGRCFEDCRSVHFGIHIRLPNGNGVTGQRYPGSGQSIDLIGANNDFEVKFKFAINLAAGAYFVGGGVWSDFEPECLHRVLDMLMIKVLPVECDPSFGYFDASSGAAELTLSAC